MPQPPWHSQTGVLASVWQRWDRVWDEAMAILPAMVLGMPRMLQLLPPQGCRTTSPASTWPLALCLAKPCQPTSCHQLPGWQQGLLNSLLSLPWLSQRTRSQHQQYCSWQPAKYLYELHHLVFKHVVVATSNKQSLRGDLFRLAPSASSFPVSVPALKKGVFSN